MKTCEVETLKDNTGLSWTEFSLNQLQAQDITETTENNNAQTVTGSLLTITPAMSQILVKITDRTMRRLASPVVAQMGSLAGLAMARKKDEDYLDLFSTFNGASDPGTGQPLSFGHIASAKNRISSNTTEPAISQVNGVLHGFQIKDLQDETVTGVGTYTVPNGLTEEVYRKGWRGSVANVEVHEDGNITVDSTPDARGAVHAKEAVICVRGMSLKKETRRDPAYGGGADEVFITDEYAFGERSAGNWAYMMLSDATAPTS